LPCATLATDRQWITRLRPRGSCTRFGLIASQDRRHRPWAESAEATTRVLAVHPTRIRSEPFLRSRGLRDGTGNRHHLGGGRDVVAALPLDAVRPAPSATRTRGAPGRSGRGSRRTGSFRIETEAVARWCRWLSMRAASRCAPRRPRGIPVKCRLISSIGTTWDTRAGGAPLVPNTGAHGRLAQGREDPSRASGAPGPARS